MSAVPSSETPATPRLRLVPAMTPPDDDAPRQPIPLDRGNRVKNTILCRNELCRLPLVEIRYNGTYHPLHAFPIRHERGTSTILCTCPACETVREVVLR